MATEHESVVLELTDTQKQVDFMFDIFREGPDYYELTGVWLQFSSHGWNWEFVYGDDFMRGRVMSFESETLRKTRLDPDGKSYKQDGVLIEAYDLKTEEAENMMPTGVYAQTGPLDSNSVPIDLIRAEKHYIRGVDP